MSSGLANCFLPSFANCPFSQELSHPRFRFTMQKPMATFLLWCLLLVFCWPLALVALVLYPLIWLILLPFRIVGIAVDGVLELVKAVILLPARLLGSRSRA
jgi:hypothetical protein